MYIKVLLPLALDQAYTYSVPEELKNSIDFGVRVEVQFGKKKLYSGVVVEISEGQLDEEEYKPIIEIIDDAPCIGKLQYKFWNWLSSYYMAYLGEVMNAALPSGIKLHSETIVVPTDLLTASEALGLEEEEYLIAEALLTASELKIDDIQSILDRKSVQRHISSLLQKGLIETQETLTEKYKPKTVVCYRFATAQVTSQWLAEALEKTKNSDVQTSIILAMQQVGTQGKAHITQSELKKYIELKSHATKALEKKKIIQTYELGVNRADLLESGQHRKLPALEDFQKDALTKLRDELSSKKICLLHGITGSGKTRLYLQLILEHIDRGSQILYLLPEIALTSQTISRIVDYIDYPFLVYHSRVNENERVDIYKKVLQSPCFVIGARSALLLPFHNLSLIIIDEEHDASYKQQDPSPRYQARDAALMLAKIHSADTILGSATPSLESFSNAMEHKYGYVSMKQRFAGAQLATIQIANLAKAKKQKPEEEVYFTPELIEAMQSKLAEKQQIILFKNRRGYAPYMFCPSCGWKSDCVRCDITLTYHKRHEELRCHYCGYRTRPPESCPECGFWHLAYHGSGTERIEQELESLFPNVRIQRLDADTVRSKNKLDEVIFDFEQGAIDILVGTQMITKGLDFSRVGLVGVVDVDALLAFSDFRSSERTFQTIIQVSGRAGRKDQEGQVVLQMHNPTHPIVQYLQQRDTLDFYSHELQERKSFGYPPFLRIIDIRLRHKDVKKVTEAAFFLFKTLGRLVLPSQVFDPVTPYVSYVKNMHIRTIMIKVPNHSAIRHKTKTHLRSAIIALKKEKGMSSVRVSIDVDPYF